VELLKHGGEEVTSKIHKLVGIKAYRRKKEYQRGGN
jgi:hypothetical protein